MDPYDGIQIVDDNNFAEPVANPQEDRITAILQKRAQPAPQMVSPQEFDAYGIGNVAAGTGPQAFLDTINNLQRTRQQDYYTAQDRELSGAQTMYQMFEDKRARGDKQAAAVGTALGQITSDPDAQGKLLEWLHKLPEKVDAGNPNKLLMLLARGKRELGIQTDFERNKFKSDLDLQKTQAEINKLGRDGAGNGHGGAGTGVERMRDWYIEHGVDPMTAASLAQKSAGMGNMYVPGQGIVPIADQKTITNLDQSIEAVDRVLKAKGLGARTGYSSRIPAGLQGYAATDAQAKIDQLKGMGFLDAYNVLKGGGQITEIEGQKATQARIRLEQATSQDDFIAGLKEWQDVQKDIKKRLQGQIAGVAPNTSSDHETPDPLGLR